MFHDPAAAVVVDGVVVAAAEEERFSRRKHGKLPVPFSTWELPTAAAAWCLGEAGVGADELDAVGYSYEPQLAQPVNGDITANGWEPLRTLYAQRAPRFLAAALPGLRAERVQFVPHHLAHAASAYFMAPYPSCAVLVIDGRGEDASHLAGVADSAGRFTQLAAQRLPHSLGFMYEELTEHLGFRRSSDEYKVMALAAYAEPVHIDAFRSWVRVRADGGFEIDRIPWHQLAPRLAPGEPPKRDHAELAASVQRRLEEVLLDLADWIHRRTGERSLAMAGGVALNCVANSVLTENGPFEAVWVQPAAGDSGTALGAALVAAWNLGDRIEPMETAALGRAWSDVELERQLEVARVPYSRPPDIAEAVAELLARDAIVGWFQGRSEFGPRALGHRSLLADPRSSGNIERLNDVKGREQFRPVAPMVLADRAAALFDGPLPSPYMLFTQRVRPEWRDRIPAAVHVDGTARIQTVDASAEPLVSQLLREFERRTGVPTVINTSLNTAGRPMVDDPRDALECFGASPLDALALGPFLVTRPEARR